ncbi:hypothetical protein SDC9_53165 [bioreactor metagenome]|uniref:Uncharacterized protein n=1 Tax=bioreactor metagenome TaxID=1076179 RepID=A0A644WSU7_9ZZZZ
MRLAVLRRPSGAVRHRSHHAVDLIFSRLISCGVKAAGTADERNLKGIYENLALIIAVGIPSNFLNGVVNRVLNVLCISGLINFYGGHAVIWSAPDQVVVIEAFPVFDLGGVNTMGRKLHRIILHIGLDHDIPGQVVGISVVPNLLILGLGCHNADTDIGRAPGIEVVHKCKAVVGKAGSIRCHILLDTVPCRG